MRKDGQKSDRPPREAECPSGSVQCRICGRSFFAMTGHLRSHGLTAREYRERFPGAVTVTVEARELNRLGARRANEVLAFGGRKHRVTFAVA